MECWGTPFLNVGLLFLCLHDRAGYGHRVQEGGPCKAGLGIASLCSFQSKPQLNTQTSAQLSLLRSVEVHGMAFSTYQRKTYRVLHSLFYYASSTRHLGSLSLCLSSPAHFHLRRLRMANDPHRSLATYTRRAPLPAPRTLTGS